LKKWPDPDRRHRIEHCTLVSPEIIRRIKASGVIPTPFWTYVYFHGEKWSQYGDDKIRWMFAHKSFLDAGIRVPGASDYTPGPFEPLMAIQSMVTRKDYKGRVWGANQKVSVDEALTIATINGAYPSFEENLKGSIAAGKLADFVVLEKDPHDVDPDQIMNIKVNRTVIGGKTVYHTGDTALTLEMQLLAGRIDLMLVPIGDNFTMGVEDAARAVEFVKPKSVIPMHYNTWDLIKADPEAFKRQVGKQAAVVILSPGESHTIS